MPASLTGWFECVVNVSEGHDAGVLAALSDAAGDPLADLHTDPDHHRAVFTLVGDLESVERAARSLTAAAVERIDVRSHQGVHPRLGAVDVVPFVALDPREAPEAADAARSFAAWIAADLGVPAFLYGDADPNAHSLPETRRDAFHGREPDYGSPDPHPTAGAVAVGARPVLVAVNCDLRSDDVDVATAVARAVRERDGGLPGVRALGLPLESRSIVQVSINLVDLERTGIEAACVAVRREADARGVEVERVELVGLAPQAALERCSAQFRSWAELGTDRTIEAAVGRRVG